MALIGAFLYALVGIYSLLVIIRLVTEMVQSFSREFAPPRWFMIVAEAMFVVTDPPVKALRRMIPPLRLNGGVGLDISVIALLLILSLLQVVIRAFLVNPFL
ncbi:MULTISPECIES: YggT family protein [unclassified Corynebacterium]|uniref:YggT family protein n=1 Tax=unclassified Corynebacterium TaxID=2624378 RepID=UPI002A90A9B8|nr:YggT family protein [Corynebacterium sp.]MDY5784892.1 YggT family protein [Corynebacterium sp.]